MSHFLSEMSCGKVVAGSLLFPGRAFEFSSLDFFCSCLHPSLRCCCSNSDTLPLGGDTGLIWFDYRCVRTGLGLRGS